jgi:DNA-binding IclR family transcriptional regulator
MPKEELDTYLKHNTLVSYTPNTITRKGRLRQDLKLTRQRGYSLDRQEFVIGIACMGAPIFDHNKRAVAAISISGTSDQVLRDKKRLERMQGELIRTAAEISRYMGYLPQALAERGR